MSAQNITMGVAIARLASSFALTVLAALTLSPPAVSAAATQFDGVYAGQRTVVRGDEPDCIKPSATRLSVKNGIFSVTYARNLFDAPVEANGSFERTKLFNAGERTVTASLKGRIDGRTLEADLETYRCQYHYSL